MKELPRPKMAIGNSRVFEVKQAERKQGELKGVLEKRKGRARGLLNARERKRREDGH